ncbi:MAG: pyrroline-5-carboxylate reductase [bacterium]
MAKLGKIGFIGIGNMGQALINGLIKSGVSAKANIFAYDSDGKKREKAKRKGIKIAKSNADLITKTGVIVLAVKPQVIDKVLREISGKVARSATIISIAAGITTRHIEALLGKVSVIRVMPNTPALVRQGAAAICRGRFSTKKDERIAERIFSSVGRTVKVKESLMDAVTGLSGSGPAYIFLVIEALTEAGVKVGLSRQDAGILTKQMVLGAAKMAVETGEDAAVLRKKVTSPGGTTEAALKYLKKKGFDKVLVEAVKVATKRSIQLGKKR